MSRKRRPGSVPEIIDHALDDAPPVPGGLSFTLLHEVKIRVTGPDTDEIFTLEDGDLLPLVQQAWRRRVGIRDGRRKKIGASTLPMILVIEDYARHHPRDLQLSAGALANRIIDHAATFGLADGLTDDGPLWNVCDKLLVFWKQLARYEPE